MSVPPVPPGEKIILRKTVSPGDLTVASDFLARHAGLPKMRVKDAMNKGAVWLHSRGKARVRLRKATARLREGDTLELFYDPGLLSIDPPKAHCVTDKGGYSIWFKPAGLLAEGTDYGDHCSLLRQVEIEFSLKRAVYPVHRLDREVSGLVLVAHTKKAAASLSGLFQGRAVTKRYRAEVLGRMEEAEGAIDLPLDGKPAKTKFTVLSHDPSAGTSHLLVEIETGRLHQIRRHLAAVGHPVMGDPRYGRGNKDGLPMRLVACELSFTCPLSGQVVGCRV